MNDGYVGADGFIVADWVTRADHEVPQDKIYTAPNTGDGLALHSMEGYGWPWRMLDTRRKYPGGPYIKYARASWMFGNFRDGMFKQYYPITASTWTSGGRTANTSLWAQEAEGTQYDPLTEPQLENTTRLARVWEKHTGRIATRDIERRNIWQHNEVWDWDEDNAGPTACPSGRYDPFFKQLEARVPDKTPLEIALEALAASSTLNAAVMKRLDLIHIATGPYRNMLEAHERIADLMDTA